MRRIGLAAVLTLSLILSLRSVDGQDAGKVYWVGWLGMASGVPVERNVKAFEQSLGERGWVSGKNLVVEYRSAEGKYERLPGLAAELVRLQPQAIVAGVTPAVRAAKGATDTIPIVMVTVGDPIGDGLITSLARPGGNVTGLTLTPTAEIWASNSSCSVRRSPALDGSRSSRIQPTQLRPARSKPSKRRRPHSGSS